MTASSTHPSPDGAPPVHACTACGAALEPLQRYCVACGARLGPLPEPVAALIGGLTAAQEPGAGAPAAGPRLGAISARAAAVAVLGLLGFGALLGSAAGPPSAGDASTPVLVALAQPVATTPPSAPMPPATPSTTSEPAAADTTPVPAPADTTTDDGSSEDTTPAPTPTTPADGGDTGLPPVRHVFVVMLSGHGFTDAFGPDSTAPYLATTLPAQGELVSNYYAATQGELANGIAFISGQGPTLQTAANCPQYVDVTPGTFGSDGQVLGDGCVFPAAAKTLADQLGLAGLTWKAYVEDLDKGPAGTPATGCRHPAPGAADDAAAPVDGDAYVTWRNPFVYFHSVADGASCAANDMGLTQLDADLATAARTPSFSYIVPNRCHDGSDVPCASGAPAGLPAADAFLRDLIPKIMASPAYQDGGLIAITFDQAPQTGPAADPSACCTPSAFPNVPLSGALPNTTTPTTAVPPSVADPATTATPDSTTVAPSTAAPDSVTAPASTAVPGTSALPGLSPGGGRVGLLLLSPFVKAGTRQDTDSYNHFSLLRSIEDLFGLDHLGYAGAAGVAAFDRTVYTAAKH